MYDQDLKDNYPKILEITFQLFYVFIYSDWFDASSTFHDMGRFGTVLHHLFFWQQTLMKKGVSLF